MKLSKIVTLPFLSLFVLIASATLFQSCNPDDCDDDEPWVCDSCFSVDKPNIYIYPEQSTFLNVTLSYPKGGEIIASIPEYGSGWAVTVDTAGIIDGKYEYLFYESEQPDVWQMEKGWCVKTENLTDFFTENLSEYGFKGREIDDFIKYWIPRFKTSEYYLLHPQTNDIINNVIELSLSETPDNILRLFYLVQESDEHIQLVAPNIKTFNREDFFITEWGVILK